MRISKKILAVALSILMAVSMMPFTVFAAEFDSLTEDTVYSYSNKDGSTKYVNSVFGNLQKYAYKLYKDVTFANRIAPSTTLASTEITIDLNGHDITSNATDYAFLFGGGNGNTTTRRTYRIINTASKTSTITVNSADIGIAVTSNYIDVELGENIVFNCAHTGVVLDIDKKKTCQDSTVTINGTVNAASEYGLTVNGQIKTVDPRPAVIVNGAVNGSTAGIYAAGNADYTINGTVTGHTGIYQKGGNLVVNNGAVVTGNGAKGAYVEYNSGMYSTGDAIVVESNDAYALGTTTINGGTITSTASGTNAVAEYDAEAATTPQDITVEGGTFVAAGAAQELPASYLAEGATQDSTTGTVAQTYVAKIGTVYYETLAGAISAAQSGDTVTLIADCSVNAGSSSTDRFPISKSLTIDGNNHTVTINQRGFGVGKDATSDIDVTFKDITITNATNEGRCVDTRGNLNSLTLDNATLKTTGTKGYLQPLTIGGNQATAATVTITDSTIQTSEDGSKGYAIITFNPVDMTIENSTVKGWACIYAKGVDGSAGSAGSTFTATGSNFISKNPNPGVTNAFGTIVFEDSDIDFNISNCNISIDGEANEQFLFTNNIDYIHQYVDPDAEIENVTATLGAGNNVELKAMGEFSYDEDEADNVKLVVTGGTFSREVPEENCADGYTSVKNGDSTYSVDPIGNNVAKVDGVLYADLEEAIAAARTGDVKTVIVLNDVDLTSYAASARHYIDITGVTVDLNNHQMDVGTHWSVCFTGTDGKVMNGTCVGHDSLSYPDYAYGIYIWGPGNGNVANSGGQHATIELENLTCNYGIHCWNADVTITDCDVTGSNAYYGVWADENTHVTIESGNFTTGGAAVLGAAKSSDGDGSISVEGGNYTVPSGKPLVLPTSSSSKPENVQFTGGVVKNADDSVYAVLAENLAPHYVQNMETGEVYQDEGKDGVNITVAETISQNFYLEDDFYADDAIVKVTYNHNSNISQTETEPTTDTVAMSSLDEYNNASSAYNGYRVFSVTQAPAQITEDIKVEVYEGDELKASYTYNTAQYCKDILAGDYSAELKELAEATLDYAAASQTMFDYNTGNMATDSFYNDVAGVDFDGVGSFRDPNGLLKAVSLVSKSDLGINLYSRYDLSVSGFSMKAAENKDRLAVTTSVNGDYHVINITGIEPVNMDKDIAVTTNLGTVTLTANEVMKFMAENGSGNMPTFARAMYLYGVAANACLG